MKKYIVIAFLSLVTIAFSQQIVSKNGPIIRTITKTTVKPTDTITAGDLVSSNVKYSKVVQVMVIAEKDGSVTIVKIHTRPNPDYK